MSNEANDWATWCEQRTEMVTAVPGNLALVAYQPVGVDPEPLEEPAELSRLTVSRPDDRAGVVLDVPAGGDVQVDGEPVEGPTFVGRLDPDGSPLIHVGRYWIDVFSLDGSDYELRIYDEQAENRDNFDHIERYSYDPALVVEGHFEARETEGVSWEFTRSSDSGHTKQVPGVIRTTIDGQDYALVGFLDGAHLVLVFADATTKVESYAPGRFLRIPCPQGPGPITIDFNRAFVPPCGFSDYYSCPVPARDNVIAAPIRAGEQRVVWKRPRY